MKSSYIHLRKKKICVVSIDPSSYLQGLYFLHECLNGNLNPIMIKYTQSRPIGHVTSAGRESSSTEITFVLVLAYADEGTKNI
jgi:hypothetical protein